MKRKINTERNLQKEYNLQFDIDVVLKKYFILDISETNILRNKILNLIDKNLILMGE